jgi:excisionase family DNA binding protein
MLSALDLSAEDLSAIAVDDIPELLGQLEQLRARLYLRLSGPSAPPKLLTVAQVAHRLGVSSARVYDLIREHEMPQVRMGRQVRIREQDLTTWIRDRKLDG